MQAKTQVIYEEPIKKKTRGLRAVKLPKSLPNAPPKIVNEIKEEGIKDTAKHVEKLDELVAVSQNVLYKCSSFFPFDFFPDEISIEPAQVNVKQKVFFWTSQMVSIPIKNISDVIINTIPFFASMTIVDRFFRQDTVTVSFLKKDEAHQARKIIQGLVIATREGVDVSKIEVKELIRRAEALGKMQAIVED